MSLRKSPTRTPALLAANRANARKSTGPRTPEGKSRAALSALRNGLHTPNFLSALAKSSRALEEYRALYLALYAAPLPDKTEGVMDLLRRTVLHVWGMKQKLVRWAASRAEREAWFSKTGGVFPAPEQLLIQRPGWRVRVSLWVRRGRGRGRRHLLEYGAGWEEGRARLHVGVTVTASIGHPLLGCSSLGDVLEGTAPRVVFKLEPECIRKDKDRENVIVRSRIETPFRRRPPSAELQVGTCRAAPSRRGLGKAWRYTFPRTGRALACSQCHIELRCGGNRRPAFLAPSVRRHPQWSHCLRIGGQRKLDRRYCGQMGQHGPIAKKQVLPHEIG